MSLSPCINTLFFHNHQTPQWLSRTQLIPVMRTFPTPHYHLLTNHSHQVPFVKKMTESILPCCKLDLISVANLQPSIMWPHVCCSTGTLDPLSKSLWSKVSLTFNNLRSSEALSTVSGRLWALSLSGQDLPDLHHSQGFQSLARCWRSLRDQSPWLVQWLCQHTSFWWFQRSRSWVT